ncbi:MAG: hypothetical protein ACJAWW_001769, partial [Sulfurimonas sp.]
KSEHEIFMLVVITVLFVKYNLIFKMEKIKISYGMGISEAYLPSIAHNIPSVILSTIAFSSKKITFKSKFKDEIRREVEATNKNNEQENIKQYLEYIEDNNDMLFYIQKYTVDRKYFKEKDKDLIEKLNNFVESGILLDTDV